MLQAESLWLIVQVEVQISFVNAASTMQAYCCFQGHNLITTQTKILPLPLELAMAGGTCRIVLRSLILACHPLKTSRFSSFLVTYGTWLK